MPVSSQLARIVRGRRLRRARSGRMGRPWGRILLLGAGLLCAAGAVILVSPLPLPAPDLQMGSGRAFAGVRTGAKDPAADAATQLLAMHGSEGGVLERARLAGALAARYGRRELAEWMINVRLYGNGKVGGDDAALTYFGVHAGALAVDQCAALEALAADPALAKDPAGWNDARAALLNRMLSGGFLDKADWARATADPIPSAAYDPSMTGRADPVFGGQLPILDSFLELVLERLGGRFPQEELPRSGIRVLTTMDLDFELQLLWAAHT